MIFLIARQTALWWRVKMTYIDNFVDCGSDTITVATRTTTISGYGADSYSTSPTTYNGLLQQEFRMVRAADGTEKVSSANFIAFTTAAISVTSRITLGDGTNRPVISVESPHDEVGQAYSRINFR